MTINWAELAKEEGFYDDGKDPTHKERAITPERFTLPTVGRDRIIWHSSGDKFFVGPNKIEFRRIPQHPGYFISNKGVVRNTQSKVLRKQVTSSNSQVNIKVGEMRKQVYKHELIQMAWPELAPYYFHNFFLYEGEAWKVVTEFENYAVSTSGRVLNLVTFIDMKVNKHHVVHLSRDGKQYGRSSKKLVFMMFNHDVNHLKQTEEYPGYAISRNFKLFNLSNMHEIQQIEGFARTKSGGVSVSMNVKQLHMKYFGW